jgi:DNA-directed RNA polymerase specialized sigma24 family protein
LSDDEILRRAEIADRKADGYLQEEALVYLVRNSFLENGSDLYHALSRVLVDRCSDRVTYGLRSLHSGWADDAFSDVFESLFAEICSTNGRSDFVQVRFWVVLNRTIIDVQRKYYRDQKDDNSFLHPNSFLNSDEVEQPGDDLEDVPSPGDEIPDDPRPSSVELAELKAEALQSLPEPIRTAFVLHHYEGWPIESMNPEDWTLSKYYRKDPKTIRNWLHKAEVDLQVWRGEPHE